MNTGMPKPKMPKAPLGGTRFSKAIVPKLSGQFNVSSHIAGQNPRKHKLTGSPGTNPSKFEKGAGLATLRDKSSGLAQHTAPYKHDAVDYPIGVGGPGFDQLEKP